ncbi:MAG: S41 family peptidase [Acidobacteriota bacterium]
MKRNILVLFAVLYLATVSNLVCAQNSSENKPQVRQKTFEKVWQKVNETYFDPHFGGVDWKKVHDIYAPKVAQVKSDAELYALLNKMLGELKVSHLQILTPEQIAKLKSPPVATGITVREIENKIVVTRVLDDSSAAKAGIKNGFVVKKIDGETVKNLKDAKQKLSGAPNTTLHISYLDEKDELREADLERLPLEQSIKGKLDGISFYAQFEAKRLTDNIGYLRFSNFAGFLDAKIKEAVESMKDAPGIIIDLRGNSGGEDQVAINLAGMLFDKQTQLMITKTRKGEDFYYKAKPTKNPYLGKIVILADELSGSASEQFAAGLQETGRAFIIGKTTVGKDLDADLEKLPTGAYLIYASGEPHTPKGVVIEGRGVIPNKEMNLTRQDLLNGKDAQLEAAIEYIQTSHP